MPINGSLLKCIQFTLSGLVLGALFLFPAKSIAAQETVPPKTVKTEVKRFSFTVKECRRLGDRLTCEVLVSNEDQDRALQLTDSTRIIDDAGNELKVSKVNFGSENSYDQQLVTGVPVKVTLVFEPVTDELNHLSLLEIYCREGFSGDDFRAQLRNVNIKTVNPASALTSSGAAKPNVVIKKELTFVLETCVRYPKNVICSFDVTNDGSAVIDLALYVNCINEKVRVIDTSGNEHLATEGGIGSEAIYSGGFGRCFARSKLAPKATIKGTAKFASIDLSVNTIKLLTMILGEAYRGNQFSIQFKDLAITDSTVKRSN